MLSVFSKRYVVAPVAGLLLSLGVNAMSQGGQQASQGQTGSCQSGGRCLELNPPGLKKPEVEAVVFQDEWYFEVTPNGQIDVYFEETGEAKFVQTDGDCKKIDIDNGCGKLGSSDNSQICQTGQGYVCNDLSSQLVALHSNEDLVGYKDATLRHKHVKHTRFTLKGNEVECGHGDIGQCDAREAMRDLPSGLVRQLKLVDLKADYERMRDYAKQNGGNSRKVKETTIVEDLKMSKEPRVRKIHHDSKLTTK